MAARKACKVTFRQPLKLARVLDQSLVHLGDSASNVMGDSYHRTQAWSTLLHAHNKPQVDGILYRSRFDSGKLCVALFERALTARSAAYARNRSIDPRFSLESQAFMHRWNIGTRAGNTS